ncbi:hypothetical protein Z948_79 [Sulfitobacter donghicola DSW-25 = KCTC 12864 = JCM 14565]|nr:hypothetical protein Z948_79 [Sulfitobacter donghicola DSW-25 = KCTC 12864 = JCM 14565]
MEALSSIAAPVCLPVFVCAKADAARLFAVADAFGSPRTLPALDAIFEDVFFVFFAIFILRLFRIYMWSLGV